MHKNTSRTVSVRKNIIIIKKSSCSYRCEREGLGFLWTCPRPLPSASAQEVPGGMSSGLSPHLCRVLRTLAAFRTPVFEHHSPLPFRNFPVCFSLTSRGPDTILRGSFSLPTSNTTSPGIGSCPAPAGFPARLRGQGSALRVRKGEEKGKRKERKGGSGWLTEPAGFPALTRFRCRAQGLGSVGAASVRGWTR